jgi:phage gpG-like protein
MRSTCQGDIYESFVKESTDEGLCIGLNAEVGVHQLGATAIQALVRGSVQAALGASNAVVAAAVKDAPHHAVGSNTSRPGMQLWVQPASLFRMRLLP